MESGNLCKEVDKEWRARFGVWLNARNMIVGTQLANRRMDQMVPLPLNRHATRVSWHEVGLPVRIIALLRATIEARAPVGYEDETGFHYGSETTDWSFTI